MTMTMTMMPARFPTFLSVLYHVQSMYQDVNKLSRSETTNGCHYSHRVNGVGCAIGCCFSEDDAQFLENHLSTYIRYVNTIDGMLEFIRKTFNENITIEQLSYLQKTHDASQNVQQFRERLDNMIINELGGTPLD